MVLKSIDKMIQEMEAEKVSIPLEKQHEITKYLLVGYDIEGRNYSEDLLLKQKDNISEYEDAKDRIEKALRREVRAGRMTQEEADKNMNRKMSNSTRNWIREKLIRVFGAIYLSDSLYLVPLQILRNNDGAKMQITEAQQFLEAWGKTNGVSIHTMANELATERDIEQVSKVYYKTLKDRFEEMDESLDHALDKLQDLQDDVTQDPKKTIRGIHRIVEAIEARTDEAQDLINRYGDPKKDQFKLTKIHATTKLIRETYERIRQTKEESK